MQKCDRMTSTDEFLTSVVRQTFRSLFYVGKRAYWGRSLRSRRQIVVEKVSAWARRVVPALCWNTSLKMNPPSPR